jgi:hypothetical protein
LFALTQGWANKKITWIYYIKLLTTPIVMKIVKKIKNEQGMSWRAMISVFYPNHLTNPLSMHYINVR